MHDSMIHHVDLFFGSADPAQARVYAAVTLAANHQHELDQFQLSGHLIGPTCDFAHTLPARIPFVPRKTDNTLLAEAIVPDPCFWTPELPFLYRADLQLTKKQTVVQQHNGIVGIRRLGIRGRELNFEGKRFVLRGAHLTASNNSPAENDLTFVRQTWTAAIVSQPPIGLCEIASRRGMLLVADLRTPSGNISSSATAETVEHISQWPAVVMAIVNFDALPTLQRQGASRNLLIGQYLSATELPTTSEHAQIIFAEVGNVADFAQQTKICVRPVIAVRPLPQPGKIEQSRAACDVLQRDLAPYGDFAGYVV
jgi:Glycosyl hydrolases family 2